MINLTTDTTNEFWQKSAQVDALADTSRAKAFGITPENVAEVIHKRSHLFASFLPTFNDFCQTSLQVEPQTMLKVLWDLWLPLAIQLVSKHQQLGRPFIQGILGGQGTGKTTMSKVLTLILQELGYSTLTLSLDDLYKTYGDRLVLTQNDPRLIWRATRYPRRRFRHKFV